VMERRPELLVRVREAFVRSLNGYLDLEDLTGGIDQYVMPPGLGPLAGPLGALALAADAHAAATSADTPGDQPPVGGPRVRQTSA
jgi:fructokinase